MSLVPALLQAVIGLDGEALVVHVGEKPYVVAASGQVELATRALTLEAVSGILQQLLPPDTQQALDEFGAIQYEYPSLPEFRNEHFTVVAARGGDDIWVEVRRRRAMDDDSVPADFFAPPPPTKADRAAVSHDPDLSSPPAREFWADQPMRADLHAPQMAAAENFASASIAGSVGLDLPDSLEIDPPAAPAEVKVAEPLKPSKVALFAVPRAAPTPPPPTAPIPPPEPAFEPPSELTTARKPEPAPVRDEPIERVVISPPATSRVERPAVSKVERPGVSHVERPTSKVERPAPTFEPPPFEVATPPVDERTPFVDLTPTEVASFEAPVVSEVERTAEPRSFEAHPEVARPAEPKPAPAESHPVTPRRPITRAAFIPPPAVSEVQPPPAHRVERPAVSEVQPSAHRVERPAVSEVQPSAHRVERAAPRPEPTPEPIPEPTSIVGSEYTGLERLLRVAASLGASTLYLTPKTRPSIRVNGEIRMLDEPALAADVVEALISESMPEANRDALKTGASTEWASDLPDLGRVSCLSFRDHRGLGGIFRMTPMRAISAEQLGLSAEMRALATESDGLVLIAGPKSSGKSTLLSGYVDLVNRTRRVYIIAIERKIRVVHESRQSLVSQRAADDPSDMLELARAALREEPDVLVIEDLASPELASLAIDAANADRLVIAGITAPHAAAAIESVIALSPAERHRKTQAVLGEALRGVIAQVLVRKPGGGHVAARELLLNTPAIAALIADGRTSDIAEAIEGGRKHGMVSLNDALAASVSSGEIDAREAYRRATNRDGFLNVLKAQGVDTTFFEESV